MKRIPLKLSALAAVFFALLGLSAPDAVAKTWQVDDAASQLTFSGTQAGLAFTGQFKNYHAAIDFDPAAPEKAVIQVTIDLKSAVTGDAQRDATLPEADWFDSVTNPQATFTVKAVKPLSPTSSPTAFVATASLHLKNITKEVIFPFTLTPEAGGMLRAQGTLTLNRHDFNIGTGEWVSDAYIGKDVKVTVNVLAK